jgi:hypothetical protein
MREDLLLCSSYLPLGVSNWVPNKHYQAIFLAPLPGIEEEEAPTSTTRQQFFWRRCRGKRGFLQGSLSLPIFYFVIVLLYFIFACIFLSKIQKN